MKRWQNILLIIVFFLACGKEEPDSLGRDAECLSFEIPPRDDTEPYPFKRTYGKTGHEYPCFNPSNPNELIYVYKDFEAGKVGYRKVNLLTGEHALIYTGEFWSGPRWGKSNWIVFEIAFQIFVIRQDGSELQQITTEPRNHAPHWNHDGTRIIMNHQDDPASYGLIMDFQTRKFVDTMLNMVPSSIADWSRPGIFLTGGGLQYAIDGHDGKNMITNLPLENDGVTGIQWGEGYDIYFISLGSIYKTNFYTKKTEILKERCPGKYYGFFTISPDKKKIVADCLRTEFHEPHTLHAYWELRIMNLDGSEEEALKLPE
jgi:hypothetical protein